MIRSYVLGTCLFCSSFILCAQGEMIPKASYTLGNGARRVVLEHSLTEMCWQFESSLLRCMRRMAESREIAWEQDEVCQIVCKLDF